MRIRTRQGTLDADRVVIATGYATPGFRPLAGRFRMYGTYVLATEPIGSAQRDEVGLADVMFWDTERPYHYARWTPDHRLIMGGEDRLVRPGPGRRQQFKAASHDLRAYFDTRLPALTTDSLPYIGLIVSIPFTGSRSATVGMG